MKKYKHLFFDLDRTLWDFERNSRQTFMEMYEQYNLEALGKMSFEDFLSTYREINEGLWDLYRAGKISKEELRDSRFEKVLAVFGVQDDELAQKLANHYVSQSPLKTGLFPGTHEVLKYLREKYELHIITNGFREVQEVKIKHSGLDKYFNNLITSEEAECKKPEPKIFNYALEKAGANIEESIMIGDDLAVDIKGAANIGMDQIFTNFTDTKHQEKTTYEVNSLFDLQEIF